jgi:hypothetical protein
MHAGARYHLECLSPCLTSIPSTDWFCAPCLSCLGASTQSEPRARRREEAPGKHGSEDCGQVEGAKRFKRTGDGESRRTSNRDHGSSQLLAGLTLDGERGTVGEEVDGEGGTVGKEPKTNSCGGSLNEHGLQSGATSVPSAEEAAAVDSDLDQDVPLARVKARTPLIYRPRAIPAILPSKNPKALCAPSPRHSRIARPEAGQLENLHLRGDVARF